jgi:exodeoxyribonuclease VII small subunit
MNEKVKRPANSQAERQLSLPHPDRVSEETCLADKGQDFENTLIELEKVVAQLEGEVRLEDALKLFDRGVQLSQYCEEFLKSAEQKIEILKKAASGALTCEKFNEELLPGN